MKTVPRLLLDTNVFRRLAHGDLRAHESRLLALATRSNERLIWLPDIAVQELLSRIADASTETFPALVSALRWADMLAGNQLREFFNFDAGVIMKSAGSHGYNFEKHRNDFHDHLLCAYPAAGYLLVTCDNRLLETLEMTGCPQPRVMSLEAGLALAEEWLGAKNLTGLRPAG
jgi:predicted nucleic acid-binding protein